MITYDFNNYKSLCVCGDIHGEFRTLIFNIKRLGITDSVIIVAGDCGIGFEKEGHYTQLYNKICKTLEVTNNVLLLVRGNHDDPSYFNERRIDFERMKCLPDYSVVRVGVQNILCIGGAISIDRTERIERMSQSKLLYWADEAAIYDTERLDRLSETEINIVVTHTCPTFCHPTFKSGIGCWLCRDATLEKDLNDERLLMDKIYEHLTRSHDTITNWYYGHFHQSNSDIISDVRFTLLDIMEIKEVY